MMEKSQALFTKMYEAMQGAQGAGADPNGFAGYTDAAGSSDNGSSNAGGSDDFAGDYREV